MTTLPSSTGAPHWQPCLACGIGNKTNRPMSYHLRKGVRKHLAAGVGYRTSSGATAVLPPLSEIKDHQCLCLACAHMLDILLSSIDKLPLANGRPLAVARAITRPRRRRPQPTLPPSSLPTAAVSAVPPLPNVAYMPTVPPDRCVVCHLAQRPGNGAKPEDDDGIAAHTLDELRREVTARVGTHADTLESTVRIFRAARVELADDGVCQFDSRTFAAHLCQGGRTRVCQLHFDELVRAADVKAAGALPCAICGDKPTLRGGDEVRLLTPLAPRCTAPMARLVVDLKQVPPAQQDHFCAHFRRFLENEFACAACFRRLDLVRQQSTHS